MSQSKKGCRPQRGSIVKKNQQVDGFEEDGEEITSGMMNPISAIEYFEKLESRRIYIFGDIDKDIILPVIYQIHILEQRGSDDIELVINSEWRICCRLFCSY